LVAGDRFELPMHLAYETGVVATLPAIFLIKKTLGHNPVNPDKVFTKVVVISNYLICVSFLS
jgi:hypothetical protein